MSELNRVGQNTILGCGKSGEGAASCNPEYNHVWGERLSIKKSETMAFVEGVDCFNLHRRSKKGHQIKSERHGILGTCWVGQPNFGVLLQ